MGYQEKITLCKDFTSSSGEEASAFSLVCRISYHVRQNYDLVIEFIWKLSRFKKMHVGGKLTRGGLVMVYCMYHLGWTTRYPEIWSNILSISVRSFSFDINN